MTFADLTPDEQDALRWAVRSTVVYGVGHSPATPALTSLWLRGLVSADAAGGSWAVTPAGRALLQARRTRWSLRVVA